MDMTWLGNLVYKISNAGYGLFTKKHQGIPSKLPAMITSNLHILLFGVLCTASPVKVICSQDAFERIITDDLGRLTR